MFWVYSKLVFTRLSDPKTSLLNKNSIAEEYDNASLVL